ncbi:MAG: TIGR03862 family flavoprotein [Ideonella sp.]
MDTPSAAAPRAATVAIVGGGPAGLMAAEVLSEAGFEVDLYDAMPSVGRKFLLAGIGGLNLTHSEPLTDFLSRYGERDTAVAGWLDAFSPQDLRGWASGLGIETFVGSSGRVFPADMKAAPLLRAWLHRLRSRGVRFHMRWRLLGLCAAGANIAPGLCFATPVGPQRVSADAVVLALGGASWPKLGSDGAWTALLEHEGVDIAPLQAANCGFDVGRQGADGALLPGWTDLFRRRAAGQAMKTVAISCTTPTGELLRRRGEFVFTDSGIEGSLVYSLSATLREGIVSTGGATVHLDLLPDRSAEWVLNEVASPRGSRSLSSHLKSRLNIDSLKTLLLHELLPPASFSEPASLAAALKALPLKLTSPRPLAEAISTAGGVRLEGLDDRLMLRKLPGLFCAGEMLDWEAPTGGYLMTACLASGRCSGQGVVDWLLRLGCSPASPARPVAMHGDPRSIAAVKPSNHPFPTNQELP